VTSLTGSMPWSRPIGTTEECPKRGPKCTLVARDRSVGLTMTKLLVGTWVPTCGFRLERATRIELACPAWEAGALPLSYAREAAAPAARHAA